MGSTKGAWQIQHIKLGLTVSVNVKLCKSTSVIGSFNDMICDSRENLLLGKEVIHIACGVLVPNPVCHMSESKGLNFTPSGKTALF